MFEESYTASLVRPYELSEVLCYLPITTSSTHFSACVFVAA